MSTPAVTTAGRESRLDVHGVGVQLFEGGTGDAPVLYLHGAGTFWWMPVHDLLARERRVVLPVHPGFGASGGFEAIETIDDLAFHTRDVLDALGLGRVDVVGLSLGGWLAAELALRSPERVGRLVLVDAPGVRLPGIPMGDVFMVPPAQARRLVFHEPESELALRLLPDAPPPDRVEMALRGREAAARLLWNPAHHYRKLTARLWRVRAETLVVWGAGDRLIPLAYGEAWVRAIPGARLEVMERCGHLPPLEAPERFARLVLDFLQASGHAPRARG